MQREKASVIFLQNIKDIAETEVDGLIKSNWSEAEGVETPS